MVATSTTEAEYVAAASCCGLVLWIQNQLLDYRSSYKRFSCWKVSVLGLKMKRAATTASSFEAEQDSDAQTRFEAASKSPMTHLSQEFSDKHNMVAYLEKSEGSEGFHKIIDFLNGSHIKTATTNTRTNGEVELTGIIDGHIKTITEASLRRHLKLEDNDGVTSLPNSKIFEQLALIGYETDSDKLTFQKGVEVPLFPTMLNAPTTSPSRITSSPSLSPEPTLHHTPTSAPSTSQPQHSQPSPAIEEPVQTPHESPLHSVHSHGSDEGRPQQTDLTDLVTKLSNMIEVLEKDLKQTKKTYSTALTKLILRVKKLENQLKSGKARRKARIVLSKNEDVAENSSKQGRNISDIDEDPTISLMQDEEMTWFQEDAEVQDKQSNDTEVLIEKGEPTELVKDKSSGDKGEKEVTTPENFQTYIRRRAGVSTGSGDVSTASEIDIAAAEKAKDKARKIQEEDQARVIAEQDQERLNFEAALEIQRYHALKIRPRSVSEVRKNMYVYLKNQGGYKMKYFKGMSYDDIRPIFERKIETKQVQEEVVQQEDVVAEQAVVKESSKVGGKRKKSLARKKETSKRQKLDEEEAADYEKDKEDLRMWLTVVPDEEATVDPKILHTKYPIVDWESQSLGSMHIYKIIRADGNTSYHKTFESMLKRFDRQDLVDLHRLVMKRFEDNTPEGYNLMLWGDLKTMFEPNAEHEVWSNQQDWNLLSWKLYENCGVHTLLLDGILISFHMLVEKRYPFTKEMLEKMLNWRLEAKAESTIAFELLKFVKSQIEEQ
ncbi:hypothetical protein Tco_1174066 [Tanacetum coccineum]